MTEIKRGKFAAVLLLNVGTLSWFFIFSSFMPEVFATLVPDIPEWGVIVGSSLMYGFAIFWSIIVSFVGGRINRSIVLLSSIILGMVSTFLLGFLEGTLFASILSSLMGTSLGLFLPSSMALIADYTAAENRGRASGLVILGTFITAFAFIGTYYVLDLDLWGLILLLTVVRSISLFALIVGKLSRPAIIEKKIRQPGATYREFLFYLCPWAMFTLASSLARSLILASNFEPELVFGENIRWFLIAIFGVASGFIADKIGRKQPIIIGLATLGIGYLLLGFSMSGTSVIIYYMLSGITWGLFFVVFLVIPGDLSTPASREKFYALGYILPLTGIFALSVIPVPELPDIIPPNLIAQILGGCLFLAMYPVFRAKETLTASKIQEEKMKEYTKKLGETLYEAEKNDK